MENPTPRSVRGVLRLRRRRLLRHNPAGTYFPPRHCGGSSRYPRLLGATTAHTSRAVSRAHNLIVPSARLCAGSDSGRLRRHPRGWHRRDDARRPAGSHGLRYAPRDRRRQGSQHRHQPRRAPLLHSAGLNSLAPRNRHGMRQHGGKLGWCPHRNSPGRTIHSPRARYRYDPHATAVERAETRLGRAPSSLPPPHPNLSARRYKHSELSAHTEMPRYFREVPGPFVQFLVFSLARGACRPGAFRGEPLRRSGRHPRDDATPGPWPPSWRGLPHPGLP